MSPTSCLIRARLITDDEGHWEMSTWKPGEDSQTLWRTLGQVFGTKETTKIVSMLGRIESLLERDPFDHTLGDVVEQLQTLREMRDASRLD